MALTLLTHRDSFFVTDGPADKVAWVQVKQAFNVDYFYFLDDNPDYVIDQSKLVVFDETGSIALNDFVHPQDAIYLFGCTGMRCIQNDWPPTVPSVRIEVPNIVPFQGMFGCQAAAIVLYDRLRKSWQ